MSLLLLLWLLFVERSVWGLLTLFAVVLHELGHLAAARALRLPVGHLRLAPTGLCIPLETALLSYRAEALVAAAGPAANLLSAVLAVLRHRAAPDDRLLFFAAASLVLAAVNLLPLPAFDGGRVLTAILCSILPPAAADPILAAAELVGTAAVWLIAAAAVLRSGANLTLCLLAAVLIWRMCGSLSR